MDRRKFLKTTVLGAATAAFAPKALAAPETKTIKPKVPSSGYVQEPSCKIPIIASADVVVVGGGPAGFSAAVGAAYDAREIGTCLVTGQAAGVAAAMASSARTSVQTLDIPSLQKALKAQKVILE